MKLPKDFILHIRQTDKTHIEAEWQGELVRCKDCKHRIINEHYGEKGYMNLKAMCELDTGDIFQLGRHAENADKELEI